MVELNRENRKKWITGFVVGVFTVAGIAVFALSGTSTPVSIEPELGTLTSPAGSISDTSASQGKALIFRQSTTSLPPPTQPPGSCTKYVSTSGSDGSSGSSSAPWRTVKTSVSKLQPGDTLCVRGGTYSETLIPSPLPKGTSTARITLMSYPGERAIIHGHSSFSNLTNFTIRDMDFTWPESPTGSGGSAAIISITGAANNFVFENNNIYHGNYAGLLVGESGSGDPSNSVIRGNYIHDTGANGVYFNPGQKSKAMLVERNLVYNNGTEDVKLGWGGGSCQYGIGEVTFRYNTLYDGTGRNFALIIADPGNLGTGKIDVYRNLFIKAPGAAVQYDNSSGCLGDRSYVHDNVWYDSPTFNHIRGTSAQFTESNNLKISPMFNNTTDTYNGFRPTNSTVQAYGKYAP